MTRVKQVYREMFPRFHLDQRLGIAGFCWKTILILTAMQKRRAPLPISPRFLKACTAIGWPENPDDIPDVVTRYLLRSDEEIVLSELRGPRAKNRVWGASAGMLNP